MSAAETAKQLFEGIKGLKEAVQAVAPGLKDVTHETKAELGRLGTQGAAELAAALFSGAAFTPYGAGQQPVKQQERGNDGMSR